MLVILYLSVVALCSPPPARIVSLAPAMTEIIYALGLGERVVGVSNVCDRPPEVHNKPKVGGFANPSLEAIVALHPDLVVMTSEGNPIAVAKRLKSLGISTYVFNTTRLTDLPVGIRDMGHVLGAKSAAERLAKSIETAIRDAKQSLGRGRTVANRKAVFIIWPSPLVVAGSGTIINDAMTMNGLINIAADTKASYPNISMEALIGRQPDLILIGSAHDEGMKKQSQELLQRLQMLDAVRKGRICYMGDALYRSGPRIPQGIAELKSCAAMP
jgi:iron complex transport system substrate-binding protein